MTRRVWRGACAVLALSVVAACGGSTRSDANAAGGGQGGSSGVSSGGAGSGGVMAGGSGGAPGGAGGTSSGGAGGTSSGGAGGTSPKNTCYDFGEWCTDGAFHCQCWGGWSCQSASDPNATYDMTKLPKSVSDGQPCDNPDLVCQPQGSTGASCQCVGGVWKCDKPSQPNPGCSAGDPQGQACAPQGALCQESGFCAPLCACTLQSTWDCVLLTPC